jgi:hypothetical protein
VYWVTSNGGGKFRYQKTMCGGNNNLHICPKAKSIETLCSVGHLGGALAMAMPRIVSSQYEASLGFGVYTAIRNVTPVLESLCL